MYVCVFIVYGCVHEQRGKLRPCCAIYTLIKQCNLHGTSQKHYVSCLCPVTMVTQVAIDFFTIILSHTCATYSQNSSRIDMQKLFSIPLCIVFFFFFFLAQSVCIDISLSFAQNKWMCSKQWKFCVCTENDFNGTTW